MGAGIDKQLAAAKPLTGLRESVTDALDAAIKDLRTKLKNVSDAETAQANETIGLASSAEVQAAVKDEPALADLVKANAKAADTRLKQAKVLSKNDEALLAAAARALAAFRGPAG